MVDTRRVIVMCTDDAEKALATVDSLRRQHKPATIAEVRFMQEPPATIYKWCVYYLKD